MNDTEKTRKLAAWAKREPKRMAVAMDKVTIASLVANLQLAVKHPQNTGEPAKIARSTIDRLIAAIETTDPEIAAILREGNLQPSLN